MMPRIVFSSAKASNPLEPRSRMVTSHRRSHVWALPYGHAPHSNHNLHRLHHHLPRHQGFHRNSLDRSKINCASTPAVSIKAAYAGHSGSASSFSTAVLVANPRNNLYDYGEEDGPSGPLMEWSHASQADARNLGPAMMGLSAQVTRTFGPRDNAEAMLICGGAPLAKHASFDPNYQRASEWIRHHAVGPAVLSPVLVSGLVGALVEAAFPQAVPIRQSLDSMQPLIVGVTVQATIQVTHVKPTQKSSALEMSFPTMGEASDDDELGAGPFREADPRSTASGSQRDRSEGHQVTLRTVVSRVRDDALIGQGKHVIWIPDYRSM